MIENLIGKTIKSIDTFKESWSLSQEHIIIDAIHFTDGTILNLWGRADNCLIDESQTKRIKAEPLRYKRLWWCKW